MGSKPRIHHNAFCIRCYALKKEMVRLGPVVFCKKCYDDIFVTFDPINQEYGVYAAWRDYLFDKEQKGEI